MLMLRQVVVMVLQVREMAISLRRLLLVLLLLKKKRCCLMAVRGLYVDIVSTDGRPRD
jgi:hypothetical protein